MARRGVTIGLQQFAQMACEFRIGEQPGPVGSGRNGFAFSHVCLAAVLRAFPQPRLKHDGPIGKMTVVHIVGNQVI